jgi:hypothetical protein
MMNTGKVLLRFLGLLTQSPLRLSDIEQPESKLVIPSDSSGKTTVSLQDVFTFFFWYGKFLGLVMDIARPQNKQKRRSRRIVLAGAAVIIAAAGFFLWRLELRHHRNYVTSRTMAARFTHSSTFLLKLKARHRLWF